jgi:hypothetical protein
VGPRRRLPGRQRVARGIEVAEPQQRGQPEGVGERPPLGREVVAEAGQLVRQRKCLAGRRDAEIGPGRADERLGQGLGLRPLAGQRQRLAGQAARAVGIGPVRLADGHRRQDRRPRRAVTGRLRLDGRAVEERQQLDGVLPERHPVPGAPAAGEHAGGPPRGGRVAEPARQFEGGRHVPLGVDVLPSAHPRLAGVDVQGQPGGGGEPVVAERHVEQPGLLGEGADPRGLLGGAAGGLHQVVDGCQGPGRREVVHEAGGRPARRRVHHGARDAEVAGAAGRRVEPGQHDVTQRRVPEPQRLVDDDAAEDRGAQASDDVARRGAEGRGQQLDVDVVAGQGGEAEHVARVRWERVEPPGDEGGERIGEPAGPFRGGEPQQLAQQQGVPGGGGPQVGGLVVGDGGSERRRQGAGGGDVERHEVDPLRPAGPEHLGQRGVDRRRVGRGPDRDDRRHVAPAQVAGHHRQHRQRRGVGPLDVVEDDEHGRVPGRRPQAVDDGRGEVGECGCRAARGPGPLVAAEVGQRAVPQPQRRLVVVPAGGAPRHGAGEGIGEALGQEGLADAGLAGEHEPSRVAVAGGRQGGPLVVPPDQRVRPGGTGHVRPGQPGRARARRPVRQVVAQDRHLEVAQGGPRQEAMVGQPVPEGGEARQGVGRPARGVQGAHEERGGGLVERIAGEAGFEAGEGRGGVAQLHQCTQADEAEPRPLGVEPGRGPGGERHRLDVDQRRPPPPAEPLVGSRQGGRRVTLLLGAGGAPGVGHECQGVDRAVAGRQRVARAARHQHRRRRAGRPVGFEDAAEVRDVRPHRHLGPGRHVVAPQGVDDAVDRDDMARVQGQDGEQGALADRAELERCARPLGHDRAEHPERHEHPTVIASPGVPAPPWSQRASVGASRCQAAWRPGTALRWLAVAAQWLRSSSRARPIHHQSEPVTPMPGRYRSTYISVVNGRKMMPSTGQTNEVKVASIRSGRAIQKMTSAKRGNIPANSASRQPMRPA